MKEFTAEQKRALKRIAEFQGEAMFTGVELGYVTSSSLEEIKRRSAETRRRLEKEKKRLDRQEE